LKALVTGITGQDGAYLSELLLSKGYEVYGLKREKSNCWRLKALNVNPILIDGDVTDIKSLHNAIYTAEPDEIYNLAAIVRGTESNPLNTFDINTVGTVNLLEAARYESPDVKFCQASSSEMLGGDGIQDELTPIAPRNIYGMSKAAAHLAAVGYRERFGMKVSSGIMFNHESPLRCQKYVTRKIVNGVYDILSGKANNLVMGDIDVKRDWGHARDYVNALWMMQQSDADDYIIATGETYSVRDFAQLTFSAFGLESSRYIITDENLFRQNDVALLCGNPQKIESALGWARQYTFNDIVSDMTGWKNDSYNMVS